MCACVKNLPSLTLSSAFLCKISYFYILRSKFIAFCVSWHEPFVSGCVCMQRSLNSVILCFYARHSRVTCWYFPPKWKCIKLLTWSLIQHNINIYVFLIMYTFRNQVVSRLLLFQLAVLVLILLTHYPELQGADCCWF